MKAIRKQVISFAMMIAMVLSLLPFTGLTAFAEGESAIYFDDCSVIGYHEDFEANFYYYNLGDGNKTVALMDLADKMEDGTISGLASAGYLDGTHVVELTNDFKLTQDFLMEEYGEYLNETAIEGLDFSNFYGLFVMDDDNESYIYIIQCEHIEPQAEVDASFTIDPGTIIGMEADGFDYDDGYGYLSFTADLYTAEVVTGTASVNFAFSDEEGNSKEVLVYGYDDAKQFVASYAPNETGEYGSNGQVGATTAVVKVDDKGALPAYLFVQTPYDASWNSTVLYVIHIEPTYAFTILADGEPMTAISFKDNAYSSKNGMTGEAQKAPLYIVNVPKGTTELVVETSNPTLVYNYDGAGEFLDGMYEDFIGGATTVTRKTDSDGNGVFDYLQVQKTYNADWSGAELLYGIELTSEEAPTPVPADYSYDYAYGSEYEVMTEARAEKLTAEHAKEYYNSVVATVKEKGTAALDQYLPNSNAKVVLSLIAAGYDPTDVDGYNLVEPLLDLEYAKGDYVTNAAYSLLALDSADYSDLDGCQATIDGLATYLYDSLGEDGVISYEYGGTTFVSIDSTAMVLQALAKHYSADEPIIAKAIALMSSAQKTTGGFTADGSTGETSTESTSTTAQVLLALAEYGIDPAEDTRFSKLGSTAFDYLDAVKLDDGFKESLDGKTSNYYSTYQVNMALVSLERLAADKTTYFDLSDQFIRGSVDLAITNNTGMFKAVTAYVEKTDGETTLVMALSGTGYKELFKGTYEQAVANGDGTADKGNDSWIHGYTNEAVAMEFRIPINAGETYVPCVAISNSYYTKYLNGQNALERAYYPRQFTLDLEAKTLVTGDYEFSQELALTNNINMLKADKATLDTVGGPNSNNYKADLVLTMGSDAYSEAFVGAYAEANAATETIALGEGNVFTIPVKWVETFGQPETMKSLANGEPFYVSLKSKKKGTWYERIFTLDEAAGTLVLDPSAADYTAVEEAKAEAEALDSSLYSEDSFDAVETALAAVEEGKFESQQAEVDAMAKAIEDAIAGLVPIELPYSGDKVFFVKSTLADADEFGMWRIQDGTTVKLEGENVLIHIVPNNTITYGWFSWGGINQELTKDVALNANGTIDISVSKDKAGYALPVAPIKKKDGKTTSAQYYLAIPSAEKLEANEAAAAEIENAIDELPIADKLTLADKDKVQAALDAYEELSEGEKAAVDNYQELKLAENVIKRLEVEDELAKAKAEIEELQKQLSIKEGWNKIDGEWYYYDADRNMQTGWVKDNGKWYFMNKETGIMQTGWVKDGNTWYYMKSSGAMAANEWCDGYWLNADGSWTYQPRGSWKQSNGRWWYGDTSGWYAKNTTVKIDNKDYSFDASGYLK